MASVHVARRQMVRTMLNQTTSNSHSHSIQESGTTRLKTTSSTLSPSTRKSDRSLASLSSTQVAESEFRTQLEATAVSATESVDKTFACTRADALSIVRTSQCAIHTALHLSQSRHIALAQGERNLCCEFLSTHHHFVFHELFFCAFAAGHT